jgi:two-component system phosphate regulon response regulator PhoB
MRRRSMTGERILVVEDEKDILELVKYNLAKEGYNVTGVASGEDALTQIRSQAPDLIILDLMLPGVDGLEVCRIIRRDGDLQKIPIIMLTAKGEEADVVSGLEVGADDYVTKPFSPRILTARIKAVLRRGTEEPKDEFSEIRIHDLVIQPRRHELHVAGTLVELTNTEFRILHFLAGKPGWVFTRNQIVDAIRGEDYVTTDRSVDVHIVSLRKKLGHAREYIETVRGVGYRFRD